MQAALLKHQVLTIVGTSIRSTWYLVYNIKFFMVSPRAQIRRIYVANDFWTRVGGLWCFGCVQHSEQPF